MSKPQIKDPMTGRFLPAPRGKGTLKHGVPYFLRTGKLPSVRGRRALARYLREFEKDLRDSLGGDLSPQREAMMRQVLRCENVLRLIELYLLRASPMKPHGVMRGRLELQPCLAQSYGHFLNVQRQALISLGLDRKRAEETLDLGRYIAARDAEKAQSAGQGGDGQDLGKEADKPKKARPARSCEEAPGDPGEGGES